MTPARLVVVLFCASLAFGCGHDDVDSVAETAAHDAQERALVAQRRACESHLLALQNDRGTQDTRITQAENDRGVQQSVLDVIHAQPTPNAATEAGTRAAIERIEADLADARARRTALDAEITAAQAECAAIAAPSP